MKKVLSLLLALTLALSLAACGTSNTPAASGNDAEPITLVVFAAASMTETLTEIAGTAVVLRKDYSDGTQTDVAAGTVTEMELKGSNVLKYKLADGTDLVVRPSGTEPKVKVYILAQGASKAVCDATVAKYAAWAETLKR